MIGGQRGSRDSAAVAARAGAAGSEALRAYRARMSRARRRYVAAIALAVALALVGAVTLWLTGEARHATLRTATSAEPVVDEAPLAPRLAVAWASDDATAIGSYRSGGTVVTYSDHAVRGRDALTGAVRWSYTRTDATVCAVASQDTVATAIFRLDGNCDEAIGLRIATGERLWNRTLMDDGDVSLQSRPGSIAITAAGSVHVISPAAEANEPSGGLDRWLYRPAGCAISDSVLGSGGVLVSQQCTPSAAGAATPTLVLRKAEDDADVWSIDGESALPVLADSALMLGWDPATQQLIALDPATGARTGALGFPGCQAAQPPLAVPLGGDALVLCGGMLSRIGLQGGAPTLRWSTPASGLPADATEAEQAAGSAIIPVESRFAAIDLATGTSIGPGAPAPADATAALAAAGRIERVGPGVLVAGDRTTMLQPPA